MRNFVLLPVPKRARELIMYSALLLILACSSLSVNAQVKRPLDKKINYKVSNVSLAEALRKLKELSGVHISFQQDQVSKQPNITVDLTDKSGRQVLDKILGSTSLVYVESTSGDVLLVIRQTKKESVRAGKFFNVNGQVVDNQGAPLSNVSIMVLPEKRGLTTDSKGVFNLTAKENDVLRFSYLGMKTEEVVVKQDDFIKVALDTAPTVMTEYVVTGYQNIDKRMLTGAAVVLTADKFLTPGVASVDQMLQGKVPGMMTVFSSGSPSASPKIRIRGTSTVLGNASPLWVVDGVIREDKVELNPLQVNAALEAAKSANFSMVGNAISGLNPNDIESITVLKDAAATSIYGVQAANGVIVVKTKRGKAGPVSIGYSADMGFTGRPHYSKMNLMNSKERVNFSKELRAQGIYYIEQPMAVGYEGLVEQLRNRQITQEEFDLKVGQLETMNTDWFDLLMQNAFNHSHTVSISGGSGKSTFYASLGYSDNKGTTVGDNVKRISARMNMETQVTSKFGIRLFLDGAYRKANGFFQVNPQDYALRTSRAIHPDSSYQKIWSSTVTTAGIIANPVNYNIMNELANSGSSNTSQELTVNGQFDYKIVKGLSLNAVYSMEMSNNSSFAYATDHSYFIGALRGYNYGAYRNGDPVFAASPFPFGGTSYPDNTNRIAYNIRHQLNYNLNLFGGRDQFSAMFTHEVRSVKLDGVSTVEPGYFPDRGNTYYSDFYSNYAKAAIKHSVESRNTISNTVSYLGGLSYTFNRKYTINSTIRSDGSNRFGQFSNQRFLPNWSVGARWDVGSEKWFDKAAWMDAFSIRASYGSQGNVVSQVGPNLIAAYPSSPADQNSQEFILALKSLPYPELRWEKSKSWNLGADLSLYQGRLTLTFNGFSKKTTDLIIAKDIPTEYGVSKMYMNYGAMTNSGWDATVTVVPVQSKNITWTQSFNFGAVYNTVNNANVLNTTNDFLNGRAVIPGKPIGSFYSFPFAGLNPVNGQPLYDFGTDKAGFNASNPATWLSYSGSSDPIVELGSSTMIRYKSFTLSAMFVVKLGNKRRLNQLFSASTLRVTIPPPDVNVSKEFLSRWKKPGDEAYTNIPAFTNPDGSTGLGWSTYRPDFNYVVSPYTMYDQSTTRLVDGSFFRCSGITCGYAVPTKFIKRAGIKSMNINGSVSNPFVIANKAFHGQDPELDNSGGTSLPITSNYTLSVNFNF